MVMQAPPVVVDADVLIRNVEYFVRKGYPGALLGQASGGYSLFSGVVLFAAAEVHAEALRHLPDIAERQGVSEAVVHAAWTKLVVRNVRFVPMDPSTVDDPRVVAVRKMHAADAHTAALTALLAPAVLATDNRKDFRPFALPQVGTDKVAIDLFALGQFEVGSKSMVAVPYVTGALTIDGSKKVIEKLGSDTALLIGIVLIGAAVLFLLSGRGRDVRGKLADAARKMGPPLVEAMERAMAAGERVGAFAVERVGEPDARAVVARRLAIGKPVMTTREIADELRRQNFRFDGARSHDAATRAWLVREPCFFELLRGHWSLGYHVAPLAAGSE
jgi:hypothetical protein